MQIGGKNYSDHGTIAAIEARKFDVPGTAIDCGPISTHTARHLNLTRSLADAYHIVATPGGNSAWQYRWIPKGDGE